MILPTRFQSGGYSSFLFFIGSICLILGLTLFSPIGSSPVYAANIVVNGTSDTVAIDGVCALREAIQAANTDAAVNECPAGSSTDTITINAGAPIVLGSALPGLNSGIEIIGNDHTISGNDTVRVFNITSSGVITISNLIITNGNAGGGAGGGIQVTGGQLWLLDSTLTNNQAYAGGGLRSVGGSSRVTISNSTITENTTPTEGGGGVNNDSGSVMTITHSTISNNNALYAGGIANYNGSVLTISNSTISGNTCNANVSGGGVENYAGGASLTIRHSTITNNNCTTGSTSAGGIYNNTTLPILSNTIVAGNSSARPDLSGSFSSAGYNLIGDATGSSGFSDGVSGDQVGSSGSPIDPLLATLADNGGATQTHALLPGSPAIDAGDPSTNWDIGSACPAQDQRGYGRTGACDIGSFEFEGNPTAVTLSSPSVSSPGPRGDIQPGIFISVSLLLGILSLQTLRRLHRSTLFN